MEEEDGKSKELELVKRREHKKRKEKNKLEKKMKGRRGG